LIYGVGGVIAPFVGIKLIDVGLELIVWCRKVYP
jgi:high-affinity K+ transport system ATPase subunit B